MAIFGKFGNVFRKVTSVFAKTGKSWTNTWSSIKKLPWTTHPLQAYRSYSETKIAERLKPFWKASGPGTIPTPQTIVTTQVRLRERLQYLFQVTIRTTKDPLGSTQIFSLMEPYEISKLSAERRMEQILRGMYDRTKYGKITEMSVNLEEVRQSRWIK